MGQVVLGQAALEKGARIHAWRAVGLEEHQIAALLRVACTKEMVEAHLKQVGRTGVAGDVTA